MTLFLILHAHLNAMQSTQNRTTSHQGPPYHLTLLNKTSFGVGIFCKGLVMKANRGWEEFTIPEETFSLELLGEKQSNVISGPLIVCLKKVDQRVVLEITPNQVQENAYQIFFRNTQDQKTAPIKNFCYEPHASENTIITINNTTPFRVKFFHNKQFIKEVEPVYRGTLSIPKKNCSLTLCDTQQDTQDGTQHDKDILIDPFPLDTENKQQSCLHIMRNPHQQNHYTVFLQDRYNNNISWLQFCNN